METEISDKSISEFFAGRSVFITGATGFMGKVLVEKLLRSCSDIAEIFLLIRPKKGLNINERLKKTLDNKLFDLLRSEKPSSFDKLIPITGDIIMKDMGLLPSDRQMLIERVSVIFHVAANVRFNESLKNAILKNTRSTEDVCILAQDIKKLVALVHISTTYTQTDKFVVKEVLYPPEVDWRQAIKIAENLDEHTLKIFTAKYMGSMPNTYTFSKKLAEQVISDYSKSLPCVILRPSIVISSISEPMPGWIDNFNGPMGMLIGGGKGMLRVVYLNPSNVCDFIPVDIVIKFIIVSAWERGIKSITENNNVYVYNCSSCGIKRIKTKNIIELGLEITKEIPLEGIIWKPNTILMENRTMYFIYMLLLHILPALFIDAILKLIGANPMLFKLQRKVHVAISALSYYLENEWKFENNKLLALSDKLIDNNQTVFGYDYKTINIYEYFKNGIIGSKLYLLNEDINRIEAAKLHRKRMDLLSEVTTILFYLIIVWILYYKNIFSYIAEIFLF